MELVVVTTDNDTGSERTLTRQEQDSYNRMPHIRLIRVTILIDTLDYHQGLSLPSHPLSEIFLTFWIVDLLFYLLTDTLVNVWRPCLLIFDLTREG